MPAVLPARFDRREVFAPAAVAVLRPGSEPVADFERPADFVAERVARAFVADDFARMPRFVAVDFADTDFADLRRPLPFFARMLRLPIGPDTGRNT